MTAEVAASERTDPGGGEILHPRGGGCLRVRPVGPADEPVLQALFDHVSQADLRFRFFSTMRHVDHGRLGALLAPEGPGSASFLAFDEAGEPVASALFVGDAGGREGEIAITVRSDRKGHGIGWSLLQYGLAHARRQGYRTVRSVESRENAVTLDLEHEAGFEIHSCPDDPTLTIATIDLATMTA